MMLDYIRAKQPVPYIIYYDAEFTSLSRDGRLISIGLDSQDDDTFYAEFTDHGVNPYADAYGDAINGMDKKQFDWLHKNVFNHLILNDQPANTTRVVNNIYGEHMFVRGTSAYVRVQLLDWLETQHRLSDNESVQLWTDCYAYDWMLLCDLLTGGKSALDMPPFISYIPIDLSTRLFYGCVDPDISREKYSGVADMPLDETAALSGLGCVTKLDPNEYLTHNSLWDAYITRLCFERIDEYNG